MAIIRPTQYPGYWEAVSADYPLGGVKDETAPAAADGSYMQKVWLDDESALGQGLIRASSLTASGIADTAQISQRMQGLVEQVSGRSYNYDDSGIVNAYVLDVQANQHPPQSYYDGMRVEFRPNVTNTGVSTVNVASIGVVQINDTSSGGEIDSSKVVQLRYSSTGGYFEIVIGAVPTDTVVTTSQQTGGTIDQSFNVIKYGGATDQSTLSYVNNASVNGLIWKNPDIPTKVPLWAYHDDNNQSVFQVQGIVGGVTTPTGRLQGDLYSGSGGTNYVPNLTDFGSQDLTAGYKIIPGTPNDIIIQWMTGTSINSGASGFYSWPLVFPNSALNATSTPTLAPGGITCAWAVLGMNANSVQIQNSTSSNLSFRVVGVGY